MPANGEEQLTQAGIQDILLKPLNKDDFLLKIETWAETRAIGALPADLANVPLVDIPDLNLPEFLGAAGTDLPLDIPTSARVLVVEDCTLTQHVITSLLRELTDNITQATDGEQAIELCHQQHFDIIYMDIHMPKIGGVQATQQIRASSRLNMYTPIIAFTSSGTLQDYQSYGMNDMLQKPFTVEALKAQFDKWTPFGQSTLNEFNSTLDLTAASSNGGLDVSGNAFAHQPSSPLAVAVMSSGHESAIASSSATAAANGNFGSASLPTSPGAHLASGSSHSMLRFAMSPAAADGATSPSNFPLFVTEQHPSGTASPGTRSRSGSDPNIMTVRVPTSASSQNSSQNKWPRKRTKNTPGHTEKEKQRRANIVNSCNLFRNLVPVNRDADKATVFRTAVEYLSFLRTQLPADHLAQYDAQFADHMQMKQLESDSARLNIDSPLDSPIGSRGTSRPDSPLSGRELSPVRSGSSPVMVVRGRSPSLVRTASAGVNFSVGSPLANNSH
ncbi:uncharacterized protein MONBRDRAFT_27791 [Monosiga brevicollis MX1]|uniref:Response regulatory domain-containing protein n=1 Tax=Monosiga brevicollis TaxID=81824 RepID=A9V6B9_MONBE|nr:uncharacterized protein MONBRDRAFT_27791 [Monosiga brevicollis MX1]EDQ87040.1 predicted protein [Monosiga brevicollis MX1]|eukprot:XP_001748279.1 hypothetical protein [Monosiga brevicollis MX1]